MEHLPITKRRITKSIIPVIAMLLILLLSACGNSQITQQRATSSKAALDSSVAHALSIGVPGVMLQPILSQEQSLSIASAPTTLFDDQPAANYYSNLAQRYTMLTVQVRGLEYSATQQFDFKAANDLQILASVVAKRQAEGFIEAKTFANQLTQYQSRLAQAQYPRDYIQISNSALRSIEALHIMGTAYTNLTSLQQIIQQLQASRLDVTALNAQEQNDLQLFRAANKPEDFSQLMDMMNAQLQETAVFSTQAIPYVGAAKLKELTADINTLKTYGQNITSFQQRLNTDTEALNNAKSVDDFLKFSSQIDNDLSSIQFALVKGQAYYLLKQFHAQVTSWGRAHQYQDSYDGNSYALDYEYDQQGIASDADVAVQSAQTQDDYQAAVDLINNDLTNLHAMQADYNDRTPSNRPHATDLSLMKYYHITGGEVFVVSLIEQTLRYYKNGKLFNWFLITSGQYDKPSPPGLWQIFVRQSPTVFKSSEPKGSAFWYPNTNINFAMEYHDGGYFFHDSWWRANYGPGTNFPHYDVGGDETFAGNGSHGCINMQESDASWLYRNSGMGATVIIY